MKWFDPHKRQYPPRLIGVSSTGSVRSQGPCQSPPMIKHSQSSKMKVKKEKMYNLMIHETDLKQKTTEQVHYKTKLVIFICQ